MSSSIIKSFLFWIVSSGPSWLLSRSSTPITLRVWSANIRDRRMLRDRTLIDDGSLGRSTNLRSTENLSRVTMAGNIYLHISVLQEPQIVLSLERKWSAQYLHDTVRALSRQTLRTTSDSSRIKIIRFSTLWMDKCEWTRF